MAILANLQFFLVLIVEACIAAMAWAYLRFRARKKHIRQALANVALISLADIRSMSTECIRVFHEQGVPIRFEDKVEDTIEVLDAAIRSDKFVKAFAQPEFPLYFALPVGAFLGELIRMQTGATWSGTSEFGPVLAVRTSTADWDLYPLQAVLLHRLTGKKGELKTGLWKHASYRKSSAGRSSEIAPSALITSM